MRCGDDVRRSAGALAACVCVACIAPEPAAAAVDYASALKWTGGLDLPGDVFDVALAGDGATAYVLLHELDEGGRLVAVDVADPRAPAIAGELPLPGIVTALAREGKRAYAVAFGVGLHVLGLEPLALERTVPLPGDAAGVDAAGGRVAVADGTAGVRLVEVSDPDAPVVGPPAPTDGTARGVAITGEHVLVAEGSAGLGVFAIGEGAVLSRVGEVALGGLAFDVAVVDGGDVATVCVALGDAGLAVVEVNLLDPESSTVMGHVATRDRALRVRVAGDLALVADASGGLFVVDLEVLEVPAVLARIGTRASVSAAWLGVGGRLAIADRSAGLQLYDASVPSSPSLLGALEVGGDARAIARRAVAPGDTLLWLAAGARGLLAVDPAGAEPIVRTEVTGIGPVLGVSAGEGPLCALGVEHLFVVDDAVLPPALVGRLSLPQLPRGAAGAGTHLFAAVGDDGLFVVDVATPGAPVVAGMLVTQGIHADVAVRGDRVYALDRNFGLHVVDAGDPAVPVVLGVLDLVEPFVALDVEASTAYVVTHGIGFGWPYGAIHVVDLSDPEHPVAVGSATLPGRPLDVDVTGGFAYVADDWAGLTVVDVRDPAAPVVVGGRSTRLAAAAVHVLGGRVYVADGAAGLTVLPAHDDPATPIDAPPDAVPPAAARAIVRVVPNPVAARARIELVAPGVKGSARGVSADPLARAHVSIYDVGGRLLRRLEARGGVAIWDGRNAHGRPVAAGTYVVRAEAGQWSATTRATLVR